MIDKSAALFEYTRHETSAAVQPMLGGFKGYVRAMRSACWFPFRENTSSTSSTSVKTQHRASDVGCISEDSFPKGNQRRSYDAAAVNRDKRALEALMRIGGISREGNQPHRQA